MLALQLQARPRPLPSPAQLRTAVALTRSALQTRTFCLRRRPNDWLSHLDPLYHRFTRYRTLKTRAKLLATLKRRSRFDWDADTRPFFTPKQLRFASHWGYHPRHGRWQLYEENGEPEKAKRKDGQEAQRDIDEFELSKKEKAWKDQVDAIKKRLEQDPYEVLFGKRFEPFWSPLVPSWMRDEMGVGWGKLKSGKAAEESKPSATEPAKKHTPSKQPEPGPAKQMNVEPKKEKEPAKPDPPKADPIPVSQPASSPPPKTYSTYSSTSWDSWTQKTRRTTWDSISGKTRRFEYDPISNRMVQVESPALADTPSTPKPIESHKPAVGVESKPESTALRAADPQAVEVPVKRPTDIRTSIPVPSTSIEPIKNRPLDMATLINSPSTSTSQGQATAGITSSLTASQTTKAPRPAALSKLPPNDLDLLTAEEVRAKMGKIRHSTLPAVEKREELEKSFSEHSRAVDTEIEALLKERKSPSVSKVVESNEKSAETIQELLETIVTLGRQRQFLDSRERNAFHIKSLTREYREIDSKIAAAAQMLRHKRESAGKPEQPDANSAEARSKSPGATAPFQTAIERHASRILKRPDEGKPLQSSVERMASKPALQPEELDDAAAHEASEALPAAAGVPSDWSNQAALLQADRVRRTAAKRPYPMSRWIDDVNAKTLQYDSHAEAAKTEKTVQNAVQAKWDSIENAAKYKRKQKVQDMLDAEVRDQTLRMQAHEGRWQHHMKGSPMQARLEEVRQERKARTENAKSSSPLQGEGDFSPTITNFADSGKWYKQPLNAPSKQELEQAERKAKDRQLVEEVRGIYEKEYGIINSEHRQPLSSNSEQINSTTIQGNHQMQDKFASKVIGAGQAKPSDSKTNNLEAQIAAQEKEAHEAQNLMQPDNAANLKQVITQSLRQEQQSDSKPVMDSTLKSAATKFSSPVEPSRPAPVAPGSSLIQWEHPPLYKVLAYDSGNDMFSTATTTSNFTGSETPISIPTALSQLYQPARFVPHFAALQQEGYQVIYGTKDLLVFKKVKSWDGKTPVESSTTGKPRTSAETASTAISRGDSINPIDGTASAKSDTDVPTGNFASPTGFVNHDSPFLAQEEAQRELKGWERDMDGLSPTQTARVMQNEAAYEASAAAAAAAAAKEAEEHDHYIAHYPKVRREEDVFTGTRRKWSAKLERREQRQREREARRAQNAYRRGGKRVRWMLIGGGTFAAASYLIGSAAEKSRKESEYRYSRNDRRAER